MSDDILIEHVKMINNGKFYLNVKPIDLPLVCCHSNLDEFEKINEFTDICIIHNDS